MYIIKPTKKEEELLNKAKREFLEKHPKLRLVSDGLVINLALRKYIGEKNE
jgi:hypothetical protein